jgi:hypothetical protein
MITTDIPNVNNVITSLSERHIEIFVRSVMRNPFIFTATDVTEAELRKFIEDTVKMTHNVINCGLPLPAEASKFQRKVIHELKDFSDYMAVLLNPFIAVK